MKKAEAEEEILIARNDLIEHLREFKNAPTLRDKKEVMVLVRLDLKRIDNLINNWENIPS